MMTPHLGNPNSESGHDKLHYNPDYSRTSVTLVTPLESR